MFQPAAAILSFVPKKREGGGEDGCGILCVRVPLRFTHTLLERQSLPPPLPFDLLINPQKILLKLSKLDPTFSVLTGKMFL